MIQNQSFHYLIEFREDFLVQ